MRYKTQNKMLKHFRFWIYLYFTIFAPINSVQLSGEIYEACPYSNICNRTAERTFDVDGMVPCCSSCSCDEDCGLNLDCCFDRLDKYKLVQKGIVACVAPRIRNGKNEWDNDKHDSYYMVQTCRGDLRGDTRTQPELSNDCRLSDEFGNSLVAPVSSLENNTIYINEQCAACNKVKTTRIKKWNFLFFPEFSYKDKTVAFNIEQHVVNKLGVVTYVPPTEENWTHKRCYGRYDEVESCNKSNVWQDLCDHLHLPFQTLYRRYQNVYCALCEGIRMESFLRECKSTTGKGPSLQSLAILLNIDITEDLKSSDLFTVTSMAKTENGCPTGYTEHAHSTCLPIYCPEGMLKIEDGCSYFALRWYIKAIVMHIKLLPEQGTRLLISQSQSFEKIESINPLTWLRTPCPKLNLTLMEVYYSTASLESGNGTNIYVTSFIVRIWKIVQMKSGINPSLIIPMFYKCVNEKWKAIIEKKTYTFRANFDKYSWEVKNMSHVLRKWPIDKNHEFIARPVNYIPRPVQYKLLAATPVSRKVPIPSERIELKKPFFCKQVRIPQSDVEIHFGEIRIISKNITVGTNEYLVNSPFLKGDADQRDWNKTTFSVCIDDYEPTFLDSSKHTIHASSSAIILIAGNIYMYMYLIF